MILGYINKFCHSACSVVKSIGQSVLRRTKESASLILSQINHLCLLPNTLNMQSATIYVDTSSYFYSHAALEGPFLHVERDAPEHVGRHEAPSGERLASRHRALQRVIRPTPIPLALGNLFMKESRRKEPLAYSFPFTLHAWHCKKASKDTVVCCFPVC